MTKRRRLPFGYAIIDETLIADGRRIAPFLWSVDEVLDNALDHPEDYGWVTMGPTWVRVPGNAAFVRVEMTEGVASPDPSPDEERLCRMHQPK